MSAGSAGRPAGRLRGPSGPVRANLLRALPRRGDRRGCGRVLSSLMQEGGIHEEFIKRVGEEVTERTSALFVLTSGAEDRERVAEEMKATYDFDILWTNLPDEQLEKLREVFAS
jgi:uncharacterized membrane protein